MGDRLTLLGTGTCQLSIERMATSALIELNGVRVLYDIGRGVPERLVQAGLRNDDIEHLVISHFHPDHIEGLIPFLHAASWSKSDPRSRDLHLYGPLGLSVQVMRILSLFGADELTRPHFEVHIHEIRGEEVEVGGIRFEFPELPPANNHGLGFLAGSQRIVLTGDSAFHDREVDFLRGAEFAVIDAGHLTRAEMVALAVGTQTPRIVCSHLFSEINGDDLNREATAAGYEGRFIVARDLMSFELPSFAPSPLQDASVGTGEGT